MLAGIHRLLATIANFAGYRAFAQAIVLTKQESHDLGAAWSEFCRYHAIPVLDEKRQSELLLATTVVDIYGAKLGFALFAPHPPAGSAPGSGAVSAPAVDPGFAPPLAPAPDAAAEPWFAAAPPQGSA